VGTPSGPRRVTPPAVDDGRFQRRVFLLLATLLEAVVEIENLAGMGAGIDSPAARLWIVEQRKHLRTGIHAVQYFGFDGKASHTSRQNFGASIV